MSILKTVEELVEVRNEFETKQNKEDGYISEVSISYFAEDRDFFVALIKRHSEPCPNRKGWMRMDLEGKVAKSVYVLLAHKPSRLIQRVKTYDATGRNMNAKKAQIISQSKNVVGVQVDYCNYYNTTNEEIHIVENLQFQFCELATGSTFIDLVAGKTCTNKLLPPANKMSFVS